MSSALLEYFRAAEAYMAFCAKVDHGLNTGDEQHHKIYDRLHRARAECEKLSEIEGETP
jgi:hypothetical protein